MTDNNYNKRREQLQRRVDAMRMGASGVLGATTGGLLLGLTKLDYNRDKDRLKQHIRTTKKQFSNDIKNIRTYTDEGRRLYNEYFDWATKQKPPTNTFENVAQDFARINFEGDLKLKSIDLQGAKDFKDLHKTYLKKDILELRDLKRKGFLRSASKLPLIGGAGLIGAGGYYATKAKHLYNELNTPTGYKSSPQKTASYNPPDRLRYMHTIDTEVVPDVDINRRSLLEAIKKHKKGLIYGAAASALAGGALYAAHKRHTAEKTAAENTDTQRESFLARNKVPLAIGAGLVGAGLVAYKGRKMFTSKRPPIANTIDDTARVHHNNMAVNNIDATARVHHNNMAVNNIDATARVHHNHMSVNNMDDILRKQQDNVAAAERAFDDFKVNTMNNIADRHAKAQKTVKETLDNIFNPEEAAKQAEQAKRNADMFAEMDSMLDELERRRTSW